MVQIGELDFSKSGKNMFVQNPLIGYLRVMRQVDCASRKVLLGILCNCEFVWFLISATINACGCLAKLGSNFSLRFTINGMTD